MKNYTPIKKQEDKRILSDTWYGTVEQQTSDRKFLIFNVSNYLKDPKKVYKFRTVSKARAGFVTIFDREETPESFAYYLSKDTQCVQVWIEFEGEDISHKGIWVDVLNMKGRKFHSVDKMLLERFDVGLMHETFPKMVDYNLWERVNANTHADRAYKFNKTSKKLQHA